MINIQGAFIKSNMLSRQFHRSKQFPDTQKMQMLLLNTNRLVQLLEYCPKRVSAASPHEIPRNP